MDGPSAANGKGRFALSTSFASERLTNFWNFTCRWKTFGDFYRPTRSDDDNVSSQIENTREEKKKVSPESIKEKRHAQKYEQAADAIAGHPPK